MMPGALITTMHYERDVTLLEAGAFDEDNLPYGQSGAVRNAPLPTDRWRSKGRESWPRTPRNGCRVA